MNARTNARLLEGFQSAKQVQIEAQKAGSEKMKRSDMLFERHHLILQSIVLLLLKNWWKQTLCITKELTPTSCMLSYWKHLNRKQLESGQ